MDYSEHYQLTEILDKEARILPSSPLYNLDDEQVYAAIMDRLAQPLSDGSDSPFSSRNPLSAHSQLIGAIVYLQSLLGHELNLVPDSAWMQMFRMLGIELSPSEYPIVNLSFHRSRDAIASGITARVPLGTEVVSNKDPSLVAIVTQDVEIDGELESKSVPARLNRIGKLSADIQPGEFSILPTLLSFVDGVQNDAILYEGRNAETLSEAMLRARQQLQIGTRCVTARDFYITALNVGAQKANVLNGVQFGAPGKYDDLVTVVVYPDTIQTIVQNTLEERVMLGTRIDVRAAEIIPIDGEIDVRIVPSLSNLNAFNIAARTIQEQVNPPFGNWGDRSFASTIANALENQPRSIYAVPSLRLKHATTGVPLEELEIYPWNLLEIQSSVVFNWLR